MDDKLTITQKLKFPNLLRLFNADEYRAFHNTYKTWDVYDAVLLCRLPMYEQFDLLRKAVILSELHKCGESVAGVKIGNSEVSILYLASFIKILRYNGIYKDYFDDRSKLNFLFELDGYSRLIVDKAFAATDWTTSDYIPIYQDYLKDKCPIKGCRCEHCMNHCDQVDKTRIMISTFTTDYVFDEALFLEAPYMLLQSEIDHLEKPLDFVYKTSEARDDFTTWYEQLLVEHEEKIVDLPTMFSDILTKHKNQVFENFEYLAKHVFEGKVVQDLLLETQKKLPNFA